jgi:hypothetical protein
MDENQVPEKFFGLRSNPVRPQVDTWLTKLEKVSFCTSQFGPNWAPVRTEQVSGRFFQHACRSAHDSVFESVRAVFLLQIQ